MSKRSPEDILRDIEESELEEAADKALAMTAEERRAALEDAGFDMKEVHAKADALHERMQRAASEQGRRRLEAEARERALRPSSSRGRVVLLVAAVAVAAIGLAFVLFPRSEDTRTPVAVPSASAPPTASVGAATPTRSAVPSATTAPTTSVPSAQRDAGPPVPDEPPLK